MAASGLRGGLGDQLDRAIAALDGLDPVRDRVLMAEVVGEATYVRHHKKKIAFIFSAMRHYAQALEAEGVAVEYVTLDDPANTQSFRGEVARAVKRHCASRVVVTEPGEWRVLQDMGGWEAAYGVPVEIRADRRFFLPRDEFRLWADAQPKPVMEFFYRDMRRRTGLLMDDDAPVGGEWNYDPLNRKKLPRRLDPPPSPFFPPDAITRDVIELVGRRFPDHFGALDGFAFAVTREDALRAQDDFIENRLPSFGHYQDAMRTNAPFLYHSVLSMYLNAGLLRPRELCAAAQDAYERGHVPLNAAEGYIRQILGWREYVRGIYWWRMPGFAGSNHLDAHRPLPRFYWTADTRAHCLKQAIGGTRDHAYAHHIQRLMVTGNFALIAGLEPAQVEEWYLIVYADAYEWVELPNVHGVILYADGGLMGSKPYAASGAYIDRMSDYCGHCSYDVRAQSGPDACPFNYLYWDFLLRNRDKLEGNPRLDMPYRALSRMGASRMRRIQSDAAAYLDGLEPARKGDY